MPQHFSSVTIDKYRFTVPYTDAVEEHNPHAERYICISIICIDIIDILCIDMNILLTCLLIYLKDNGRHNSHI